MRLVGLLVLLMLVTGPAYAVDAPWEVTDPDYLAVLANRPGARLKLQMRILADDVTDALNEYRASTGGYPPSPLDFDRAGFLPLRALAENGQPFRLFEIGPEGLPAPGTIGLRYLGGELQLVVMGAEGDALSPIVQSVPIRPIYGVAPYLSETAPSQQRLWLLDRALRRRCLVVARLRSQLPDSWRNLSSEIGWELNPVAVTGSDGAGPALLFEWDPATMVMRSSQTPPRRWMPESYGRIVRSSPSASENTFLESRDLVRALGAGPQFTGQLRVTVDPTESLPQAAPPAPSSAGSPNVLGSGVVAGQQLFPIVQYLMSGDFAFGFRYWHLNLPEGESSLRQLASMAPWLDYPLDPAGDPLPLTVVTRGNYFTARNTTVPGYVTPEPAVQVTYWDGGPTTGRLESGWGVLVQPADPPNGVALNFWVPNLSRNFNGAPVVPLVPSTLQADLDQELRDLPRPWSAELESAYVREFLARSTGTRELALRMLANRMHARLSLFLTDKGRLPTSGAEVAAAYGVTPLRYRELPPETPFGQDEYGIRFDTEPQGIYMRVLLRAGSLGEQRLFTEAPKSAGAAPPSSSELREIDPVREPDIAELDYTPAYRFTLIEPTWTPEIVEVTE